MQVAGAALLTVAGQSMRPCAAGGCCTPTRHTPGMRASVMAMAQSLCMLRTVTVLRSVSPLLSTMGWQLPSVVLVLALSTCQPGRGVTVKVVPVAWGRWRRSAGARAEKASGGCAVAVAW